MDQHGKVTIRIIAGHGRRCYDKCYYKSHQFNIVTRDKYRHNSSNTLQLLTATIDQMPNILKLLQLIYDQQLKKYTDDIEQMT